MPAATIQPRRFPPDVTLALKSLRETFVGDCSTTLTGPCSSVTPFTSIVSTQYQVVWPGITAWFWYS